MFSVANNVLKKVDTFAIKLQNYIMNYENPEYSGNIESHLLAIDVRGEQMVLDALQDLYDDRESFSLAGSIGDSDDACEAIALSFIDQYIESSDIGIVEDHFTNPNSKMLDVMKKRTKEIESDFSYKELKVVLDDSNYRISKTLRFPRQENSPEQTVDVCVFRGSGIGGISIEAEIWDEDSGFSTIYKIRLSQLQHFGTHMDSHVLHASVFQDEAEPDRTEDDRLLFDVPEYHKSMIVETLSQLADEEIFLQFQEEIQQLENIMGSHHDPVAMRDELEDIGFIF